MVVGEEIEILTKSRADGISFKLIGGLLGRTAIAVELKAQKMGLMKGRNPYWTLGEDKLLKTLCKEGLQWGDIGAKLGKSLGAMKSRYYNHIRDR